jgi:hypothetical protein
MLNFITRKLYEYKVFGMAGWSDLLSRKKRIWEIPSLHTISFV